MSTITRYTLTGIFLASSFLGTLSSLWRFSLPESAQISDYSIKFGMDESSATIFDFPYLSKDYNGFKEALAFLESRGMYHKVNPYGYVGKYQFGSETLSLMGVDRVSCFVLDPSLQEKVFYHHTARNKWILRKDIPRSVGQVIDGHIIDESGILAAAHLAGAGNVKKYLRSQGQEEFKDANGTQIKDYLVRFSGYNMDYVSKTKNPSFLAARRSLKK
jgi:hypothetical protein